jgi:exodeoxyribonuclease V
LVVPPNLHTNTIFFIDEASMIGDYSLRNDGSISPRNLLEDVINYVYSGKNCKIIFIGDVAQLPPVGSDFSPALNLEYLQQNYGRLTVLGFQLKNVLRQAEGSDILINATQLRSAPENAFPKFSISSNKDLIRLPGDELQDALDSAFSTYGRDETIIITRSNKRANLYNQQVRSRILWYEEDICGGDLVMVVRNNYFWLDDKSQAGFIANGEIMEIERISSREEMYGFQFADARVRLIDYPKMGSIEVKIMLDVIYEDTPNLSREKMKELFFAVERDYGHERNKKKRYERVMADPYFNALQIKFAYAVTCHKSQGGQWACVFLDQGFLTEDLLDHNFFRWLYTAFTRSTEKLYLINFEKAFFE